MQNHSICAYWCTWNTQNCVAEKREKSREACVFIGDQGAQLARAMLNEETVFGTNGWASMFPDVRKELYLMFDDGWDVPYGVHPDTRRDGFGSLLLNKERFPFAEGTPAERLQKLNERVKACGWRGAGVWVAAQKNGEGYDEPFSSRDEEYWRERILWCKEAKIEYWKVDWGTFAHDNAFRKFLTDSAQELYPGLTIEHAICCPPLNGLENVTGGEKNAMFGRFGGDEYFAPLTDRALSYSDIFRTYDVLPQLATATTFDRLAYMLPRAKGYLNAEDELYMAASLGCQMGIMRNEYGADESGAPNDNNALREIIAAVNWQRLAPPFFGGDCNVSEEILYDDYAFSVNEVWYARANGKTVRQGAPAIISRNAPLPAVFAGKTGEKPFTAFADFGNGVCALGIFRRTVKGRKDYVGGKVVCTLNSKPHIVALFGLADSIELRFSKSAAHVAAQSLLGGEEIEIPLPPTGNFITIDKDFIGKLWKTNDSSAPAILLKIN